MKQFKKWLSKEITRLYEVSDQLDKRDCCKVAAEISWRECCKWLKSRIVERLKVLSIDDNVACVRNIENDIRQELNECLKIKDNDGRGFRTICLKCGPDEQVKCRQATLEDMKEKFLFSEPDKDKPSLCRSDEIPKQDGRREPCFKVCTSSERNECNAAYNSKKKEEEENETHKHCLGIVPATPDGRRTFCRKNCDQSTRNKCNAAYNSERGKVHG